MLFNIEGMLYVVDVCLSLFASHGLGLLRAWLMVKFVVCN